MKLDQTENVMKDQYAILHAGRHQKINYVDACNIGLEKAAVLNTIEYKMERKLKKNMSLQYEDISIEVTVRELQKHSIPYLSQPTIKRKLDELVEEGFLEFCEPYCDKRNFHSVFYKLTKERVNQLFLLKNKDGKEDHYNIMRGLFPEDKRVYPFDPYLASDIGLKEAIVLQQIHFWVRYNFINDKNIYHNQAWSYNSLSRWQKDFFPFLSLSTVKRVFKNLRSYGLLLTDCHNKKNYDKTLWYTVNYKKLESLSHGKLVFDVEQCSLINTGKNLYSGKVFYFPKEDL